MLRAGKQQAERDHGNDSDGDNPVNIVERHHCRLRLHRTIKHSELLMSTRESGQIIEDRGAGQMLSKVMHSPGIEDRKVLDQTRLMHLLAAQQGISHKGDANCRSGIAQHVE